MGADRSSGEQGCTEVVHNVTQQLAWRAGDLGDLIPALDVERQPAWHAMDPTQLRAELGSRGKCSAMVKVTGEMLPETSALTVPQSCRLPQLRSVTNHARPCSQCSLRDRAGNGGIKPGCMPLLGLPCGALLTWYTESGWRCRGRRSRRPADGALKLVHLRRHDAHLQALRARAAPPGRAHAEGLLLQLRG